MKARMLIVGVAAMGLIAWRVALSCGPFIPQAQFRGIYTPPDAANQLKHGRIGILRPEFSNRSLIVAYRYLIGAPLTEEDIDAVYGQQSGVIPLEVEAAQAAQTKWSAARRLVNVPGAYSYNTFRSRTGPNIYEYYPNCLANAFIVAGQTLQQRIKEWGASNPDTLEWVRGQDQVFSNCEKGESIPSALPANTNPELADDRRYQIAAAEFYSERFSDAERDFDAIAHAPNSSWRDTAAYVAARVLIREATVQDQKEAWDLAKARFEAIGRDPAKANWKSDADAMLSFIKANRNPSASLQEIAAKLETPRSDVARHIIDFNLVFDKVGAAPHNAFTGMADWIETFHRNRDYAHSMACWRETNTALWLIPALTFAKQNSQESAELIAAAARLRPTDVAYPTTSYLAIGLLLRQSPASARPWLDTILSKRQPAADENEFRAERMSIARNWTEFLRDAPRTPVAESADMEDYPVDQPHPDKAFDLDFTDAMNRIAPLNRWTEVASSAQLPRNLQRAIAQKGWTRAALIGDRDDGVALAKRLSELSPDLAPQLQAYLDASDPAAAQFAGAWIMLHNPGLKPVVEQGYPRSTKLGRIDNLRDNWWNLTNPPYLLVQAQSRPAPPRRFPTGVDRDAGAAQYAKLVAVAAVAPNYLSKTTVEWAKEHPQDPRNAEALALAVKSTRYGMTDKQTTNWSKAAFLQLHRNYAQSTWAQKTKYWF